VGGGAGGAGDGNLPATPAGIPRPSGLWVADQMQLRLRNAADLALFQPAPWLNNCRAVGLAISVAAHVLLALMVVAVLARRQIAQREAARFAEVEFAAKLAERNRPARELHDSIAQELNAVSMQRKLAKNSATTGAVDGVLPHLATAQGIVRGCLPEVRASIGDMRSHLLEKHDLLGALRTMAEHLGKGRGGMIHARAFGRPRRGATDTSGCAVSGNALPR